MLRRSSTPLTEFRIVGRLLQRPTISGLQFGAAEPRPSTTGKLPKPNLLRQITLYCKNRLIPLNHRTITVLDIETTGLDPEKGEILEISAIKLKNDQLVGEYTSLVKAQGPVPDRIRALTGITDAMVASAPDFRTVIRELARFMGPTPLLAGHHINFDLTWIRTNLKKAGMPEFEDRFRPQHALCTKTLAQRVFHEINQPLKNYSLGPLTRHFGITNEAPHRALSDTLATASLLQNLLRQLKESGQREFKTASALLDFQGPIITQHDQAAPGNQDSRKKGPQ